MDRSRATLEQLRGELDRLHRETLEIRLATEELWVQLSGAAPPAALVQSLGRIRGKLAEHYRLANAELHAQKEELERTRGQLAEQHDKLAHERRRFEQWAATQQKETQQQASRLIARERQLDRRETELRTHSQQWQVERLRASAGTAEFAGRVGQSRGNRRKDGGNVLPRPLIATASADSLRRRRVGRGLRAALGLLLLVKLHGLLGGLLRRRDLLPRVRGN